MLDFLSALGRPIRLDDLDGLKRDREEAERQYNHALSLLQEVTLRAPEMPHPPPSLDEFQITPLNQQWDVIPADFAASFGGGWRGRLRHFIWRTLAPIFEKQQSFNSTLVNHINRNIPVQREITKASETTIAMLRAQLTALDYFQQLTMHYVQHITLCMDAKDREHTGYLEYRIVEHIEHSDGIAVLHSDRIRGLWNLHEALSNRLTSVSEHLSDRQAALSNGLSGVSDELQKRWESMVARERRFEARVAGLAAFESSLAAVQRSTATLKRELERVIGIVSSAPREASTATSDTTAGAASPPAAGPASVSPTVDSYKYVGFEDQFRGSREEIRKGLADYVPFFEGARDVLDIGCGRGEFLDLLRESGIEARGLDINHEMVEVCREQGFNVAEGDAVSYLSGLSDESLGGIIAAQVVEHLQPDYLLRLLDLAFQKLRPGSTIILETINPACWTAFFESYIRDITHVRPLHPETLQYLLVANGFQKVEIQFRAPYPEHAKLQRIAGLPNPEPGKEALSEAVDTFNENVEKVNRLLFSYFDYAAVGRKL